MLIGLLIPVVGFLGLVLWVLWPDEPAEKKPLKKSWWRSLKTKRDWVIAAAAAQGIRDSLRPCEAAGGKSVQMLGRGARCPLSDTQIEDPRLFIFLDHSDLCDLSLKPATQYVANAPSKLMEKFVLTNRDGQPALFLPFRKRELLLQLGAVQIDHGWMMVPFSRFPEHVETKEQVYRHFSDTWQTVCRFLLGSNRAAPAGQTLYFTAAFDPEPKMRQQALDSLQDRLGEPGGLNQTQRRHTWCAFFEVDVEPPSFGPSDVRDSLFQEVILALLGRDRAAYNPFRVTGRDNPPTSSAELHVEAVVLAALWFPDLLTPLTLSSLVDRLKPEHAALLDALLNHLGADLREPVLLQLVFRRDIQKKILLDYFMEKPRRLSALSERVLNTDDPRGRAMMLGFFHRVWGPAARELMLACMRQTLESLSAGTASIQPDHLNLLVVGLQGLAAYGEMEDIPLINACRPHCYTEDAMHVWEEAHRTARIGTGGALTLAKGEAPRQAGWLTPSDDHRDGGWLSYAEDERGLLAPAKINDQPGNFTSG